MVVEGQSKVLLLPPNLYLYCPCTVQLGSQEPLYILFHKRSSLTSQRLTLGHQAPDQAAFTAEFEVFVNVVNEADAAKEAEKRKHIFPLTSRVYRLALTAPVTVAGNERTFS